jgi:hypothetical protein
MSDDAKLVFISWSGEKSKLLARAIAKQLPMIVPNTKPFMSEDDISKGERGLSVIESKLKIASFGIICLTPDNKDAPWINFEAGAISNQIQEKTKLSQIMFELEPSHISKSPLRQFQATFYDKDDFRKLFISIGTVLENSQLESNIPKYFDKFWPELKGEIDEALSKGAVKVEKVASKEAPEIEILKNMSRQVNSINYLLQNPERILPADHLRNAVERASDTSGLIETLQNEKIINHTFVSIAQSASYSIQSNAYECLNKLNDDDVSEQLRITLRPLLNDIVEQVTVVTTQLGTVLK